MQLKILFFVACSFIVFGCDQIEKLTSSAPEDVVIEYMGAKLDGRYDDIYELLSAKDRAAISKPEYIKIHNTSNHKRVTKENYTTYNIEHVTISGDEASVDISLTLPDIKQLFPDFMSLAMSRIVNNKSTDLESTELNQQLAAIIKEKMESGKLQMITQTKVVKLVKEADGWKIFTNEYLKLKKRRESEKLAKLEMEKYKRTIQAKALVAEGRQLKREKKLRGAKEKYNEALQLDSELVEASKEINEIDEEIANFEKKQIYLRNIKLYELKAKYHDSLLHGRTPGVEFKLKNTGDKILNMVEVTVYFKDAQGNIIYEEDYHPVNISSWNFMEDHKPLKPNYIWQLEQGKFYPAKAPSEWVEGSVTAKITDIEFAK